MGDMVPAVEPIRIFYLMSKHIYLRNAEHGYLYRMYPQFREMKWDKADESLFKLPEPDTTNDTIKKSIHGIFSDRYNDKNRLMIILIAHARLLITDEVLEQQEERNLKSEIHVEVEQPVYEYDFKRGNKYLITIDKVRPL